MKDTIVREVQGTDELNLLASELLKYAKEHTVIAFYGEMGSGKTTFIRNICELLGAKENVTSPTFSIVNEYTAKGGNAIYHFDFYRIKNEIEAVNIGCEEYFESGSICLIEWPEKILNLLPEKLVRVDIKLEGLKRSFSFSYE